MTAIPDPPWRDSTDGGEAERYREVLRALESATGRVAARLELRWEKGDDDTLRKAVMVCTAATMTFLAIANWCTTSMMTVMMAAKATLRAVVMLTAPPMPANISLRPWIIGSLAEIR